ncbi:phage minor head protein [uncultured Ilyobacter sp.]|uniref:phage minor head protein n=1 Tax=uncultured Ilyobacter sp. TaxID=544433 RepID=UPI00374821B3
MIGGYNVGTYREQMSAKEEFPYLMYDAVGDEDTMEICRRLDEKIYLATDPIWNDIYPGNHYQCRSGG